MRDIEGHFEFEGHWRRAKGAALIIAQIAEGTAQSLIAEPETPEEPIVQVTNRTAGWDSAGNYHYQEPWDVTG